MNISFRPNVGLNIASMAFQRKKKAGVSPSVQKAGADIFVKRNTIPKEISEMSKTARVLDVEAKELKGKLEAKANYIVELFESNGIGTNNRASAAITKGKTDGEKVMGEALEDGTLRISTFKDGVIVNVSEYTGVGRKNEIIFQDGKPVLYFENIVKHGDRSTATEKILNIEYGEIAAYKKGVKEDSGKRTVAQSLSYSNGAPCVFEEGYESDMKNGDIKIAKELWYSKEGRPSVYLENYALECGRFADTAKETVGKKLELKDGVWKAAE